MAEIKKVMCRFCPGRCRLLAHTEKDHLVKLEVDRSYPGWDFAVPPTAGCLRLHAAKEFLYHPDRLSYPLKRAGEKGEGKWAKISWDQALDEIAAKLAETKKKYGAEGISFTDGTGRTNEEWIRRFFNLLGTPNQHGANSVCYGPDVVISTAILGWPPRLGSQVRGNASPKTKSHDSVPFVIRVLT